MARGGRFWLGMMLGAVAGTVTALLYAPKPGEELRRDVKARAGEAGKKAGEAWGGMKESTTSMARTARERARQTMAKGQEMAQTYRGRLRKAVHAGREAAEQKRKELKAELEEERKAAEKA